MRNSVLKTLKILFTTCFACLMLSAGAMFVSPALLHANAEESKTLTETTYHTDGASVRVFRSQRKKDKPEERELVKTDKQGIRFHIETNAGYTVEGNSLLDTTQLNAKNGSYKLADGYKTYTLVIPTRLLEGDLTRSTSKVLPIDTSEYWFSDQYGNWESIAYIYSVPENMYTDEFSYRGIIVNTTSNEVVASTEIQTRSLAYVAKMAYKDTIKEDHYWGTAELDAAAAPLIKQFVPFYTINYTDANGNSLGSEEVLWGDKPQAVPATSTNAWYDTKASEEVDVTKTIDLETNRTFNLVTTNSAEFILTGVATHSDYEANNTTYHGAKVYATLPTDTALGYNVELDIHAVNVEYQGAGTFSGLQGVWTLNDEGHMRLFFAFDTSKMQTNDKLIIKGDSVFYANGVMYKLTKDYTITVTIVNEEASYGIFLGYLTNQDVTTVYNAPEDTDNDQEYDEFTIRVTFEDDILINSDFRFENNNLPSGYKYPVYVQCGQSDNVVHQITGGIYYWNNGNDKILELIAEDNMAYGWHTGDKLYAAPGTKIIQNGGYYIFEDGMSAEFLAVDNHSQGGIWTTGLEKAAYGSDEFKKFGEFVDGNEVRFTTSNLWFDGLTAAKELIVDNRLQPTATPVYYTPYGGTAQAVSKVLYHGYSGYQILGFADITNPKAGDTITILGGTRFWGDSQNYCTVGDLVDGTRSGDIVFCYNGQIWFSRYDTSNDVIIENGDVGDVNTDGSHSGEIRLWLNGSSKQVLNSTTTGFMIIADHAPAFYNNMEISGLNKAFYYGSGNDMVSLITNITTATEGDYFIVPAGAMWWTTFYGEQDPINRSVTFTEDLVYTFVNGNWTAGDQHVDVNFAENSNVTVMGNENGVNGSTYTFTVTPNTGYVITRVTRNGVELSGNNGTYSFVATEASDIVIETVIGYNVTFKVEDGAIVNDGAIINESIEQVAKDTSFSFTVSAEEGYKIARVTGATYNNGTYTVTPTGHTTVTIETEKLYQIHYANEAGYTITATKANGEWVENGTTVTFTVTPSDGYVLTAVSGATKSGETTYVATVNGADITVTATAIALSDLTIANTLLSMENRSGWPQANGDYYFGISYTNGTNKWLNTREGYTGFWNDNGATLASKNNGVDIMEYILIDDVSARELVTKNANGETNYKGTAFPLSGGGILAPISIETSTSSGLMIRIVKDYKTSFKFTIKAGFILPDEHGNLLYVSDDISYTFENGTFTKILNANQIDATNLIGIENRSNWASNTQDNYCFGATYTNGTNGYLNTTADLACYWNNNAAKASLNNGVDIMEYIYINDTSARTLSNNNLSGVTSYTGTTFPFSIGGEYAPITIESTTDGGIWIRVMKDYVNDLGGSFTITIKAGFTILDENGNQLLVNSDIRYSFQNGTLTRA